MNAIRILAHHHTNAARAIANSNFPAYFLAGTVGTVAAIAINTLKHYATDTPVNTDLNQMALTILATSTFSATLFLCCDRWMARPT